MRVLIDECLPRKLKRHVDQVDGHLASTVPEMGWAGAKNGALLRLAASLFDAFITIDTGLLYQQNLRALLAGSSLAVVVLQARSNRYEALLPLVSQMLEVQGSARPGDVATVGERGS